MKRLREWAVALVICAAIFQVGCGGFHGGRPAAVGPNVQAEGMVAFYGRQVISVANTALTATETITDTRLTMAKSDVEREQIKADARAVITIIKQVGDNSQKLAAVLRLVDGARTAVERKQYLDAARDIIAGTNSLLTGTGVGIDDSTTRATITRVLGAVSQALMALALALPNQG